MSNRHMNNIPYIILTTLTLFLSAFLLFVIQPMAGKSLLPLFGGVSMVWVMCMLYFQCILLMSYTYSFLVNRYLEVPQQKMIHCVLLLLSLPQLPILWQSMPKDMHSTPTISLLTLLGSQLTFPLSMVCSTAPLLQAWFAKTNDKRAKDPYFLYVASNLGSFVALLSYPFVIEKYSGLRQQSFYWSVGYVGYTALVFIIVATLKVIPLSKPTALTKTISSIQRFRWIYLSFIPVSLMLGVTTFLTTDIASIPLLWVIPLALYLLTFVITFSKKPVIRHTFIKRNIIFVLILTVLSFIVGREQEAIIELILSHLLAFFMVAMLCHGELILNRPSVKHLNEFYLFIALGGVLGGMFNGILAPFLFKDAYEYPIALILGVLVLPSTNKKLNIKQPIIIAALLFLNYVVPRSYPWIKHIHVNAYLPNVFHWVQTPYLMPIICLLYMILNTTNSKQFALCLAILFTFIFMVPNETILWQGRNFFGIKKITEIQNIHSLINQTTVHGIQVMDKGKKTNQSMAYYKPVLEVINSLDTQKKRVAIIGLGIGIIGCQFKKDDELIYYEIDPQVLAVARNTKYFTLIQDCKSHTQFTLGDARLNIAKAKNHSFDIIILDAFNSDAVPTHLLTEEALTLYSRKLKDNGVLLFNISNRHIDFAPVLSAFAMRHHVPLLIQKRKNTPLGQFASEWGLMTTNTTLTQTLMINHGFLRSHVIPVPWTDDYSNVIALLK